MENEILENFFTFSAFKPFFPKIFFACLHIGRGGWNIRMDFDKRGGWNKRGGWKIFMKSINVEGGFSFEEGGIFQNR